MQGYNLILVIDAVGENMLMCRRRKDPYKGLSNLVGGKIEPGENGIDAAYRELYEETHIGRQDISLRHLMDFTYHLSKCYVEVYVGRLRMAVDVFGDEPDLYWSALDRDYFDMKLFAGEGNIGHILEILKIDTDILS